LRLFFVFILFLQVSNTWSRETAETFDPIEIRSDFKVLYDGLRQSAFDIYALTSREELDRHYKRMSATFREPMTCFEIETEFKRFVARIHQAHARIESDYSGYLAYRASGGAGFPLSIEVVNNRLVVTRNNSSSDRIKPGDIITVIGRKSVPELLPRLTEHISAESTQFAEALLEIYMPLLICLELGSADSYRVEISHLDDSSGIYELRERASVSEQHTAPSFSLDGRENRMLTKTIAYLRPGAFHKTNLDAETYDSTEFIAFIDAAFGRFIRQKAKQLILDLRDNPGGGNSFSDPLIVWFADRPFRFASKFQVRISEHSRVANDKRLETGLNETNAISQLYAELYRSQKDGDVALFQIPLTNPREGSRFEGDVFVLVNRRSFSNTVTVGALIQDYNFGLVMGEETVDMATTFGAMEQFTLPNTARVLP